MLRRVLLLIPAFALVVAGCGDKPVSAPAAPSADAAVKAQPETAASSTDLGAGKLTARSKLDAAIAAAREWERDAELVGVTTGLADGPAHDFWFYDFQSPAKSTCTRIRVLARGSITNVGGGDTCRLATPVSTRFVDSPVAYDAAVAAGFRKGDSVEISLSVNRDRALPAPRECWVLWSDADGGEEQGVIRGWCVDPATGAFVTRLSGFLAPAPTQG